MDEVFVIVKGEYSDWDIVGYAESETDAAKICSEHPSDGWYFMRVSKMKRVPRIKVCYTQEVVFDNTPHGWAMRDEPDRYTHNKDDGKRERSIDYWKYNSNIIVCRISQDKPNRKKAEKIAQDMLYEFLAKEV